MIVAEAVNLLMSKSTRSGIGKLWFTSLALAGIWGVLCANPTSANAQETRREVGYSQRAIPVWTGYHLKKSPGWSLGLEAYAGIGVLADSDGTRGHELAGGQSILRISYVQMGASMEAGGVELVGWHKVGGFLGAYLPLVNWVDVDASVGLAKRTYFNGSQRYGAGGLEASTAALTFRLGFTDRLIDERFGLRLGGALLFDADLRHKSASWTYEAAGQQTSTGTTPVGGYTVGLAATVGFDVAFRRSVN